MRRLNRLASVIVACAVLVAQPAAAQSMLRDAETEIFLHDLSKPLILAANLDPNAVDIQLIGDPQINAFVANGQIVHLNSGLIRVADNANQVQGVIAHELGHIAGGHLARFSDGMRTATGITILSLLLGAAAMAAGAPEAGSAILMGGQQAAMSKFLAFSRAQEGTADAAAVGYLSRAHVSGKGMLDFFKKLENEEFRLTSASRADQDAYAQTHPLTQDRIATLDADLRGSPWWNTKTDPALEARYQRIRAKLVGFTEDPSTVMRLYPETDQSVPAHYARAYAWHRGAYPDRAVAEVEKLVALNPNDPYFLELDGQILLESGRPADAIPPLRRALAGSGNHPLIATLLGHALVATELPANMAEAKGILRSAVTRDRENPLAWYELGIIYDREGDTARAALASAERYNMEGQATLAAANANMALQNLPRGSPDWIRAQDIAMVSKPAGKDRKRK